MDRENVTVDKSQVAQISIWLLFLAALFSLCARLGTKYFLIGSLHPDDWIMLAAQVVYLAQTICASVTASQGLGKDANDVAVESRGSFLKAEYASLLFFILGLAVVKWAISVFIKELSPDLAHRRINLGLRIVIGLWLATSTLVSLFQCAPPTTWDYISGSHCINRQAFWTYVTVLNMITELVIVALYYAILWNLQMRLSKKTAVLFVFSTRILVIGASGAQLAIAWNSFSDANFTSSLWLPTILTQVVLCSSIVTACIPHLKPFMESLESGINRVENIPGSEEELSGGANGQYLSDLSTSLQSGTSSTMK